MNFDISKMHSIFESANKKHNPVNDETGSNLDNTLGDADLPKLFDDICPITGDVYASMKNAAKDPKNLKITAVNKGNGDSAVYIEAVEFATFIEASDLSIGEAAEEIVDTYSELTPELRNAEFHVVFPSDAINKNVLGGENLGLDANNDWAMQLMRGCRRYGLKVNAGVEDKPDDKPANNDMEDRVDIG